VHRQALTGDHRLVHLGLAVLDHAVDGDLRPGPHQHQVADRDLRGGHLHLLPAAQHNRPRRREIQQGADRVTGSAPSAHLKPVPEQHERRQHGDRLIEHVPAAGQRDHQRVQPARPDRHRDQHHHVQGPGPQRPQRPIEEDRVRVEDHRQAQQHRPLILTQPERHPRVKVEDVLADRRPDQDRNRERRRDQEPITHVGDHGSHRHSAVPATTHHLVRRAHRLPGGRVAGLLLALEQPSYGPRGMRVVARIGWIRLGHRVTDMRGHRLPSAVVAALDNPLTQLGQRGTPRIEHHSRGLRDRIDLEAKDARTSSQPRTHDILFRRPQQAADIEHHRAALLGNPLGVSPRRRSHISIRRTFWVVRHRHSSSLALPELPVPRRRPAADTYLVVMLTTETRGTLVEVSVNSSA
jgi:hypothetical protein